MKRIICMQTKRITGTLVLCLVLSYFAGCQSHHGSIADEETLTRKTLEVRIASEDISVKAADPELEKGESLNCLACYCSDSDRPFKFLRKPRAFEIKQQLAHSLLLYLYKKGCHDETSNR